MTLVVLEQLEIPDHLDREVREVYKVHLETMVVMVLME